MTATALIIDDEPDIRELCALTLTRMGLDCHTAANLEEARNLLGHYDFQVCLTDMRLPDGNGVEFVRYIQSVQPTLPVAVITAHGNMEAAVEAMKNGAYDFVSKPVDITLLRRLVVQAVSLSVDEKNSIGASAANSDSIKTAPEEHKTSAAAVARSTDASGDTEFSVDSTAPDNSEYIAHVTPAEGSIVQGKNDVASAKAPSNANEHQNDERSSSEEQAHESNLPPSLAALAGKRQGSTQQNTSDSTHSQTGNKNHVLKVDRLVGTSDPIMGLRHMIAKVARTNAPVWITGESGTGKELIARLIHENGPRTEGRFVAVNCGAIPSELMESELFGHKKGSFTGATSDHDGLFRRAEGGTLFLDEVAELPLHMQVKLLRAIQERSVRPVGASDEIPVDVRVLSASHKDLAAEVEAGSFRHDLYYRLNVISIRSPSLREHLDDIEELADVILCRLQSHSPDDECPSLSADAVDALKHYQFPGNVRELENMLERAVALSDSLTISANSFDLADSPSQMPIDSHIGGQTEAERITAVLQHHRWNRKAAAAELGLTYRQLRYRIQQLGLDSGS